MINIYNPTIAEPVQTNSEYGLEQAIKDSFKLTVNTFGAMDTDKTGRSWQHDPSFSVASKEAEAIFNKYGVSPADKGNYIDENNYSDLEVAIQKNLERKRAQEDLATNYPVGQIPLQMATSLFDIPDLLLMPVGYKALSSIKVLNDLGRTGTAIKTGASVGLSATASEALLQEEASAINKTELENIAMFSSVFGVGLGSLAHIPAKVPIEKRGKVVDELTGKAEPTKGQLLGTPNETAESVDEIFNDFSHVNPESGFSEVPQLKGALSKLVWSPVAKVMKSTSPTARKLGSLLENTATTIYDEASGMFYKAKETAMDLRKHYMGYNVQLMKSLDENYRVYKENGGSLSKNDYKKDVTLRYRRRTKEVYNRAFTEYESLPVKESQELYVELKNKTIEDPKDKITIDSLYGGVSVPKEVNKGLPRYSYRKNNFSLNFENEVDKAIYQATAKAPNNVARDYLKRLGLDDDTISRIGSDMRVRLKQRGAFFEKFLKETKPEDIEGELLYRADIPNFSKIDATKSKEFIEPDDFEELLVTHYSKEVEPTIHIDDDLKPFQDYFNKHQVAGEKMKHGAFTGKNGKAYITRIWDTDKIIKLGRMANDLIKAGIKASPSTQRELNKVVAKLKLKGKSLDEIEEYIEAELDKIVESMVYNIKEANIIKEMSVRELTQNVAGTSPFNTRKIKVDEEVVSELLEQNAGKIADIYSFKTAGKLAVKQKLGTDTLEEAKDLLNKVREEGVTLGRDPKEVANDLDNLEIMLSSVWGNREIADRPNLFMQKATRWAKKLNNITLAGAFGWVNTMMEIGTVVSAQGLQSMAHFVPAWKEAIKMYRSLPPEEWVNEVLAMGYAGDIYTAKAFHRFDNLDTLHSGAIESGLDRGVNLMYHLNGQSFMTTVLELMSAPATMTRLLKQADNIKLGKQLSKSDRKQLARYGLDENDLINLSKESKSIVRDDKGIIKAFNFDKWADKPTAMKIQQAIKEGIKEGVVQADASTIPAFATDPNNVMSQLLFQYLRFPMGAHERLFLKGVDEPSIKQGLGAITAMGIFAILITLREEALVATGAIKERDRKYNIFDNEEHWSNLGKAVWGKTAHLGIAQPLLSYMSALTGSSDPMSNYQGTPDLASLGGVSLSRLQQWMRFSKDIQDGNLNNASLNFVKMSTPYNTVLPIDLVGTTLINSLKE